MNDRDYWNLKRAVRRFVLNEHDHFVGATKWVVSLKPKANRSKEGTVAYRNVEALVVHFRPLLGQDLKTILDSDQAAYRVLITSWLLAEESHEPFTKKGGLYGPAGLPECLRRLPVLSFRECSNIARAHRLDTYLAWRRLVLAAMKAVADPGYLALGPETAKALPQPEDKDPVPKDAVAMYRILCSLPETEGRSARELVDELSGEFASIDEDRIRRLAGKLRPHGLDHRPSAGYFVPLSRRPKS